MSGKLSAKQVQELAVAWAEERLADPAWLDLVEFLDGRGHDGSDQNVVAMAASVVDLVVAPRRDVPKAHAWKTVIPNRWPHEKLHSTLGRARSAISHGGDRWGCARAGTIYELRDREWVVFHEVPDNTLLGDLPWKRKGGGA